MTGANHDSEPDPAPSEAADRVSRRTFMHGAGAVGLAAVAAPLLSAGSASASSVAQATAAGGAAKRGGQLIAGFSGGSSSDTLNAEANVSAADNARNTQLYEPLTRYDQNAQVEYVLAEELEPNANATVWTIRVRPGVTFHDGKPLTADDVLYSLRYITNAKHPYQGASMLAALDLGSARALDRVTLRVPCHRPFSILPDVLADTITSIIPEGYDSAQPVGTGPFKYKSFTPGESSTFVRNPDYWQAGLPYVDEVVIVDYSDETSQVNALSAGQVHLINTLSAASIVPVQAAGNHVLIQDGGGWTPFTMRVDIAPFSDVRVRQAFRALVDRRQMMDVLFDNHGTLGNDLFAIWDPAYDHSLSQRGPDIELAKHLLKQAGHQDLTVELVTAPIAQGTTLAAQLLAQQAKAAGITVNVRQLTTTAFFGPEYLKWPFAQDYWYYFGYMSQVTQATLTTAFYNECHFSNARYNVLYNEACAIPDPAKRRDIEYEMQNIDWTTNGYIIPYFPPVIDGYSSRVQGVTGSKNGSSFNYCNFKNMWLA
jgi:peptide/nickel transport system substrate-binding protein